MSDNKWIHIDNWMGKILGLRANELICFAVIYAFTRDGKTLFCGDLSYLAATMFATKPTVLLCLKKLLEQNLILKQEKTVNGIKRCYYQTNIVCDDGRFYKIDTSKEPLTASKEPLTASKEPLTASKEPLTVYINDNKENNKENKEKKEEDKSSTKKNRFVKPTIEQINAYIKEKGYKFTAEQFYYHYESNGWIVGRTKMVDWKAACRTWEHNRKSKDKKDEVNEEIPEERLEGWHRSQNWMNKAIPRIAGKIGFKDFDTMRGTVYHNRDVFSEILHEINNSDYEGDIVAEFCRLAQTEKYNQKIFGV